MCLSVWCASLGSDGASQVRTRGCRPGKRVVRAGASGYPPRPPHLLREQRPFQNNTRRRFRRFQCVYCCSSEGGGGGLAQASLSFAMGPGNQGWSQVPWGRFPGSLMWLGSVVVCPAHLRGSILKCPVNRASFEGIRGCGQLSLETPNQCILPEVPTATLNEHFMTPSAPPPPTPTEPFMEPPPPPHSGEAPKSGRHALPCGASLTNNEKLRRVGIHCHMSCGIQRRHKGGSPQMRLTKRVLDPNFIVSTQRQRWAIPDAWGTMTAFGDHSFTPVLCAIWACTARLHCAHRAHCT